MFMANAMIREMIKVSIFLCVYALARDPFHRIPIKEPPSPPNSGRAYSL